METTKELYNKIIDGDAHEAEKIFDKLAMLKAQDRIDDTWEKQVNEFNGTKSVNEKEENDDTYYASLNVDNTEKLYKIAKASKNWKDFEKEMLKNKNLFPDKHQINFNKVDWEAVYSRTMEESVLTEKKLGIVWQFNSKEDLKKFVEKDRENVLWGPTKDKEEALQKVEHLVRLWMGEAANWKEIIVAKVKNEYYGVAGQELDPEKFGAKNLKEEFLK